MDQKALPVLIERLSALSDATRLRLLRLLAGHELSVAELCDILQMPQSTVSRHLKVLADQNWLTQRREGTTNLYHLPTDQLDQAAGKLWHLTSEQADQWPFAQQDDLRLRRVLAQREKDPQAFFATAASQWDALRQELYGDQWMISSLLAMLPSQWTVADLGCGSGSLTAMIAPMVRQVIAVDQSSAMLQAAKRRTKSMSNIQWLKSDLTTLPIPGACCDTAILTLVLTYIDDVAGVLKQVQRILKPGGTVTIVDLLHHDREDFRRVMQQKHPGFRPDMLADRLEKAGFRPGPIRPLPPQPQTKGPALLLARATLV